MTETLHSRVARSAERTPDARAVVLGAHHLTLEQVDALANRVARTLVAHGCRKGDRVALLMPKEPTTIAAMLGTLKAGCAYVPVDLDSPAPRAAQILAAADPAITLVSPTAVSLLDDIARDARIRNDLAVGTLADAPLEGTAFRSAFSGDEVAGASLADPGVSVGASDLAHILFTSGSTGTPKGVQITHANVTSFLDWAIPTFGIDRSDRLSGHPPLHFDLSTFDVYAALSTGAELHLVDPALNLAPRALARFIEEGRLTQWFSVPSTMAFLASYDVVPEGGWPELRRVLFCGEVLPTPVLRHWMTRLPHATFTNLYGPTEATIASSFHTFSEEPGDATAPIPIGTACTGEELLVLDPEGRPVPTNEIGQLHIAGVGLSPGYWRDPSRTADAFVPDWRDPGARLYRTGDLARVGDDGLFYFLGRADTQVKSRGYRIELAEIETAVNAAPGVGECAVVGVPSDGFEGLQIACAYATAEGVEVGVRDLRARLLDALPRYMVPTRWLALPELPRNPNGKIDRNRVRDLFTDSARPAEKVREAP